MSKDILIISDSLIEPPSEVLAFRTITMISNQDLKLNVLLHTTQELKDLVYKFAKPRGLLDYISYILNEFEYEDGIRIDDTNIYPDTIVVKWIRLENQLYLLEEIKSFLNHPRS